ncbi:CBO0543 family protein [Halalkalibacter okhensis]|uniref:Uncharacterized protein n=1 Tax=Halalkalibacter okhensis TaxID=333138 RepID=A0A0B0IHB9_9BACI|nr:CBO0543 family protein [Halalkalibacter okhensis]KHF40262.1 hypothetical protein LQ50_11015 [Halalkalibacter okhensis]
MEKTILRGMLMLALLWLPFTFRGRGSKDSAIAFFFTGYIASFLSRLVIHSGKVKHPVRLLPAYFRTNIVYEYLILPLITVWFNKTTKRSTLPMIIFQSFLYSAVHTIIERILEQKTNFIKWKDWSAFDTFFSISLTLVSSRGFVAMFSNLTQKR